jgi:hypothetical protein
MVRSYDLVLLIWTLLVTPSNRKKPLLRGVRSSASCCRTLLALASSPRPAYPCIRSLFAWSPCLQLPPPARPVLKRKYHWFKVVIIGFSVGKKKASRPTVKALNFGPHGKFGPLFPKGLLWLKRVLQNNEENKSNRKTLDLQIRFCSFFCTWFIHRSYRACKKKSNVSMRFKVRGFYGREMWCQLAFWTLVWPCFFMYIFWGGFFFPPVENINKSPTRF